MLAQHLGKEVTLLKEFTDTSSDAPDIHPTRYCNTCYSTLLRMRMARQDGKVYRTSMAVDPHVWSAHQEVGCTTCVMGGRKTGGRPKKKKRITGCSSYLTEHLHHVASARCRSLAPLTRDRFLPVSLGGVSSGLCINDLVCKICNTVLDEVLELPCKHLVCLSCTLTLLEEDLQSIPCPNCEKQHEISFSSFSAPSPLTVKLLSQLVVRCEKEGCSKAVYLGDLRAHLASNCKQIHDIRPAVTIEQILEQPTSAPPTQLEMEAAGHVVRRKILSQSHSQAPFSLPTGGCVSTVVFTIT